MTRLISKGLISVATASVLMTSFTGCMDSKSTTGSETQAKQATGTVVGLVTDTNGAVLPGVTVYLAGKETTTDAGGQYRFDKVPVVNVAGADNDTNVAALIVTIAAPTGHMGATVTVTPEAQIDDAETAGDNDNGISTGNTVANGVETFIDGFMAQATTAVLPALEASVTGRLENAITGAPVADTAVTLDFNTIANSNGTAGNTSNNTTYSATYTTTTDANGNFTFTELPVDTNFNMYVGSYTTAAGAQLINTPATTGETSTTDIGDIAIVPVVKSDNQSPFVTRVNGLLANNWFEAAAPAMLNDDTRQVIVINFSEPMNLEMVDDNSVIVKAGATAATMTTRGATVTTAADNMSITVTLDSALADAELLDISLLASDFQDVAGNELIVGGVAQTDANTNATDDVQYDSNTNTVGTNNGQVVVLLLQGFNDINTEAAQVQTVAQQLLDTNGATDDSALVQAASTAFSDNMDGVAGFTQVNNNDDDDVDGTSDTQARLTALATNLAGAALAVDTSYGRVTFTPTGAAAYNLSVSDNTGNINAALAGTLAIQGGNTVATFVDFANVAATDPAVITPVDTTSVTPIEFTVDGMVPGQTLTITPVDDLGYAGTATTLAIVDNVEPTTVLQNSYGAGNNNDGDNTVVKYGNGGELSDNEGSSLVGTPYLAITPAHLDNLDNAGIAVAIYSDAAKTDYTPDGDLSAELWDNNTKTTTGTRYAAEVAGAYDTVAWANFNQDASLARTIGVAFSEDVTLNGVTPTSTVANTTLSGWKENNDVTTDSFNAALGANHVDLINFDVANVMSLGNLDDNAVIDFTGIADNAGNVASTDANARVVISDVLPPFVTQAEYDGSNVIITFNEPINMLTNTDTISITSGAAATRTAIFNTGDDTGATPLWSLSNNDTTLTINGAEFAGLVQGDFDMGQYNETVYGTNDYNHAALEWNAVADKSGNTWAANAAGVATPLFAIADTTPLFQLVTTDPRWSYTAATNTMTATFTVNQPITTIMRYDWITGTKTGAIETLAVATGGDTAIDALTDVNLGGYITFRNTDGTIVTDVAGTVAPGVNVLDVDADGTDDVDFDVDTSEVAFSNGNRTVTITLVMTDLVGTPGATLFDKTGVSDFGSMTLSVGKGDGSNDSEDNRVLDITINQ